MRVVFDLFWVFVKCKNCKNVIKWKWVSHPKIKFGSLVYDYDGSGENGLLFPCFYVYFSKVHQNLLNFAGGAPSSTAHFSSKVE